MLSELAFPHIWCCLSAIPSDLMKSTEVDESLSSMNPQFCSRENQLLQEQNCEFNFYFNKTDVTPSVLDGGPQVILANWPNYKRIICTVKEQNCWLVLIAL